MSTIVCPRCEHRIHLPEPPKQVARDVQLTHRQKEVADLACQGLTNPDISNALHISQQVVKNYLRVVYDKVGAENRVMLVNLVLGQHVRLVTRA